MGAYKKGRYQEMVKEYNSNPNKCNACGKNMLVKRGTILSRVKEQRFCDLDCKKDGGKTIYRANPNKCEVCKGDILDIPGRSLSITKGIIYLARQTPH